MPEQSGSPTGTTTTDPTELPAEDLPGTDTAVPAGVETFTLIAPPTEEDATVEKAKTKKLGPVGWLAIGWMSTVLLAALLAPYLPIPDPNKHFIANLGEGPSPSHLLGTDSNGGDLLSRVCWGARASLLVSLGSIAIGVLIGGSLGLFAGYYGRRLDSALSYLFNILLAIPQLVLALAVIAVFANQPGVSVGTREMWLIFSLGLVSIPILARITRASAISWSNREFVLAAKSMGAKNRRIIWREVLPNVLPAMFSIALLGIAVVIAIEGGLSILGVGVPPSTPSWGNMVAIGRGELTKYIGANPQVILVPSMAIFFTVLSLNYLGDVVRARFDIREAAI